MKCCVYCASTKIIEELSLVGMKSELGYLKKRYFSRLEFKDIDPKHYWISFCKKHPWEKIIKKIMYKKSYDAYLRHLSKKYAFDKNIKLGGTWECD